MQRKISGKARGDGGGLDVGVGSMVLARFSVDKEVYRAKVEDVIEEELFSVRYIDYGNSEDCLTKADIYSWDKLLELIPPQAVSCGFYKATAALGEKTSLTMKEMEAFTLLMKQSSPMQMVVQNCNKIPMEMFNPTIDQTGPELSVSLRGKDGRDVLHKLGKLPAFSRCFVEKKHQVEVELSKPKPKVTIPTVKTIKQLEALQPPTPLHPVPAPLHLRDAELVQVCGEDPPSPVHPMFTSRAVEKVMSWLDRKEEDVEDVVNIEDNLQSFEEPDFLQQTVEEPEFLQQKKTVCLTSALEDSPAKAPALSIPVKETVPEVSSDAVFNIKPVPVVEKEYKGPTLSWQQVEVGNAFK